MLLEKRLAALDPATLEAGPETDALVAECLGGAEKCLFRCPNCGSNHFGSTVVSGKIMRQCHDGCGRSFKPAEALPLWSTDPGLAFSVLWPWLMSHTREIELKKDSLWVLPDWDSPDGTGYMLCFPCDNASNGVEAIHLCRAVAAVAKEVR